jgi:hypothetical protein
LKALVIYGTLNGMNYPVQTTQCNIGDTCINLNDALSELLPNPPHDPVSGNHYTYSSNGTNFAISTALSDGTFYNYFSSRGFTNSAINDSTLVANWPMNEGTGSIILDKAGINTGIINGASWVVNNNYNRLSFDGINDYVNFGNQNGLKFGSNSFTISLWMNLSSQPSTCSILIGNE